MQPATRNPQPAIIPFFWADRLRVFATLMMISVHVSGPIAEHFEPYDTLWWWTANTWDSICRPSVPLFVMLSGWLLFQKTYEIGAFFKKRFSRVVVPGIVWGVIYLIFTNFWEGRPATFSEAGRMLLEGPTHYHLWFIYLIIGLYACYPFIAPWVRQASEREFLVFFGIAFFSVFVYKILDKMAGIQMGFYLEFFSNQLIYFVGGYYLGQKRLGGPDGYLEKNIPDWHFGRQKMLALSLALIAIGTSATAVGTYFMGRGTGVFHPYFYDYLTPNVACSAVGWFLLFRHIFNERPASQLVSDFAQASYGVYLCHVIALYVLNYDMIFHSRYHPLIDVPLTVFLCAIESFVFIYLAQKTPLGKWLS